MRRDFPTAFLRCTVIWLTAFGISGAQEPTAGNGHSDDQPSAESNDRDPLPVAAARQRAKLLHEVYAATLDVMHERYFRGERAIVPARAMEDVFAEMERQQGIKARWIAVNAPAMSISHEPTTDFEKLAAKAIADGRGELDEINEGYYRRAGAIPLGSSCIACHTGFFKEGPKKPLFAGLVISIPVAAE